MAPEELGSICGDLMPSIGIPITSQMALPRFGTYWVAAEMTPSHRPTNVVGGGINMCHRP